MTVSYLELLLKDSSVTEESTGNQSICIAIFRHCTALGQSSHFFHIWLVILSTVFLRLYVTHINLWWVLWSGKLRPFHGCKLENLRAVIHRKRIRNLLPKMLAGFALKFLPFWTLFNETVSDQWSFSDQWSYFLFVVHLRNRDVVSIGELSAWGDCIANNSFAALKAFIGFCVGLKWTKCFELLDGLLGSSVHLGFSVVLWQIK